MKGLTDRRESATKFLMVKYNSICEVSRKPREGFEPITVLDVGTGEEITKFIHRYDLEGVITAIEWRDTKQQYDTRFMSWRLHIDAAGTPIVLEIPWKSNASDRFMKMAENIDYTKPVEFRVWEDTKGKGSKTAFALSQDGKNVPAKYTRDNMGDCPEPVEELDGWNFRPQQQYLHAQMLNVVMPKIAVARELAKGNPEHQEEPEHGDAWEGDDESDF